MYFISQTNAAADITKYVENILVTLRDISLKLVTLSQDKEMLCPQKLYIEQFLGALIFEYAKYVRARYGLDKENSSPTTLEQMPESKDTLNIETDLIAAKENQKSSIIYYGKLHEGALALSQHVSMVWHLKNLLPTPNKTNVCMR